MRCWKSKQGETGDGRREMGEGRKWEEENFSYFSISLALPVSSPVSRLLSPFSRF